MILIIIIETVLVFVRSHTFCYMKEESTWVQLLKPSNNSIDILQIVKNILKLRIK